MVFWVCSSFTSQFFFKTHVSSFAYSVDFSFYVNNVMLIVNFNRKKFIFSFFPFDCFIVNKLILFPYETGYENVNSFLHHMMARHLQVQFNLNKYLFLYFSLCGYFIIMQRLGCGRFYYINALSWLWKVNSAQDMAYEYSLLW